MAQNIIVLSYSLAIAASSMIQFHHHLHNGGVHIIYNVIFETLIGEYQLSEHEHIDSGATSPEEHKDCSLTLDYFHISSNDNNILSPELFSSAIIYEHQPPILKSNTCTTCSRYYKNILNQQNPEAVRGLDGDFQYITSAVNQINEKMQQESAIGNIPNETDDYLL